VRIVHTSDWHLGRALHQESLAGAHAAYVDFLVRLVREESVGAVLVSGDVYDRALPAPDTVALLGEALVRLVDAGASVVLTSGNHDSAVRLAFASDLLARAGVHVRTTAAGVGTPVLLDGVAVYPLPYLEPAVAGAAIGAAERSHASVLRAAMGRVRADAASRGMPVIAMAHAFVAGAVGTESERDIAVGGVNVVPADVFAGVSFAALGHLHRPQEVRPGVSYSGSPVAFSFGEADHVKSVSLLDLGTGGTGDAVAVTRIPTPVIRPLAVVRGDLDDVLADGCWAAAVRAWCQVLLTDPVRPLGAFERLRRRFPHLLSVEFHPRGGGQLALSRYAGRVRPGRSEIEVCDDFLAHVRGGAAADESERRLLGEAFESVRLQRAELGGEGGREDVLAAEHATQGVA
jgi:exonuclease SbcD